MLKWLSNAHPKFQSDLVTDDPLATITVARKAQSDAIYSVSRINPLFEEDGDKKKKRWHSYLKQSSSGYESRYSSDHVSSGFGEDKADQGEAITILEQNTSFVKSILVAVRGKKPNSALNPIPEHNIDYTIPRPVWPRTNEKYRKQHSYKNEDRDRDTNWYSTNEKASSMSGSNFIIRPKMDYEEKNESTKDILKDIANTINLAIEQKNQISPEDLLNTLSHTINKNWKMLSSESAVRQLSQNLNQSEEAVATISRAFSHSSSFSEPFITNRPLSAAEAGRLSLLRRLGKLSLYEPPVYEKHVRESSTSSEETSSGFSEFSPTPETSSSDSPTSRRSPENSKVPLFTHDNLSTVSNGLRNVVLYGSGLQCRDGPNDYEKLDFRDRRSLGEENTEGSIQEISPSDWNEGTKQCDTKCQSSNVNLPGYNFPDFTLDTHQAEKLMNKIQATKRQRCWCRMATCLFGLLFLLLSVMAVSMFLTRGQRMFGSL